MGEEDDYRITDRTVDTIIKDKDEETDKDKAVTADSTIMGQMMAIFKESIEQSNADKQYWLEKLAEMNKVAETMADYLEDLADMTSDQRDSIESYRAGTSGSRFGRAGDVERARPMDLPVLQEYTVDPGAPPSDALYYSISPADVYPEWGPRENVPWYNWGVWAKFGWGEYGGSMVTGVHLPHGARIWGWRVYAHRDINVNHPTTMTVRIVECEHGLMPINRREIGQSQSANFQPGGSAEFKVIFQDNLDHSVDNNKNSYYFDVGFGGDGSGRCWFAGATIIYLTPV